MIIFWNFSMLAFILIMIISFHVITPHSAWTYGSILILSDIFVKFIYIIYLFFFNLFFLKNWRVLYIIILMIRVLLFELTFLFNIFSDRRFYLSILSTLSTLFALTTAINLTYSVIFIVFFLLAPLILFWLRRLFKSTRIWLTLQMKLSLFFKIL